VWGKGLTEVVLFDMVGYSKIVEDSREPPILNVGCCRLSNPSDP